MKRNSTLEEAALYFKVSDRKVLKWSQQDDFPHAELGGMYDVPAIELWLLKKKSGFNVQIVTERGDDLVATAARGSFNRRASEYTDEQNKKLINYLANAKPSHFAPIAHVRLTLRLKHWMIIYKKLTASNKAGMIEVRYGDSIDVSHSFYGWVKLLQERKVHFNAADSVIDHLQTIAPACASAFNIESLRPEKPLKDQQSVELSCWHYEQDFVTLRVELPITIARQFMKSVVGYIYSEASGRYITYSKIYMPTEPHGKPDNKKQGSGKPLGFIRKSIATAVIKASYAVSKLAYNVLQHVIGVAPEEARCVMPMYTGTVIVVTAARADWDRFLMQRLDAAAQTDIRILAQLVDAELNK